MEHVSSVHPTGKFPEKVENLKRWARFPGWNFRTECRVPFTFLVVCTSSRSTVGHRHRGLRPNGTTFYQSEIPLSLPPKFPVFFPKWKAPKVTFFSLSLSLSLSLFFDRKKYYDVKMSVYLMTGCEPAFRLHVSQTTISGVLVWEKSSKGLDF